jgi:hypothetical protein
MVELNTEIKQRVIIMVINLRTGKIEGFDTLTRPEEEYGVMLSSIPYSETITGVLFDRHGVPHDNKEPVSIVIPLETYQEITSDLGLSLSSTENNRVSWGYSKVSQKAFGILSGFGTSFKSDASKVGTQKFWIGIKLIGDTEEFQKRIIRELNKRYCVLGA